MKNSLDIKLSKSVGIRTFFIFFINFIKTIKFETWYILTLFMVSRVILTDIGVKARKVIQHKWWVFSSSSKFFNIWAVHDAGYYINIASNWYPAIHSSSVNNSLPPSLYAFFPLYPFLMRILGDILGCPYYIAGLIISNLCLLVSAFILYKFVKSYYGNKMGLRVVLLLFLFPGAFIFSGCFTESLFLMCTLCAFYFSSKNRWFLAGIFGGLAAMTRSPGVLIAIPLFYEYMYILYRSTNSLLLF